MHEQAWIVVVFDADPSGSLWADDDDADEWSTQVGGDQEVWVSDTNALDFCVLLTSRPLLSRVVEGLRMMSEERIDREELLEFSADLAKESSRMAAASHADRPGEAMSLVHPRSSSDLTVWHLYTDDEATARKLLVEVSKRPGALDPFLVDPAAQYLIAGPHQVMGDIARALSYFDDEESRTTERALWDWVHVAEQADEEMKNADPGDNPED